MGELLNHKVFVQKNAGKAIGFTDEMYQANGAQILENASSVFDELINYKRSHCLKRTSFYLLNTPFLLIYLAGNKENAKVL